MLTLRCRSVLFLAVVVASLISWPSRAQTTIWPLGDSITYGEGRGGGYRERLFLDLSAAQFG